MKVSRGGFESGAKDLDTVGGGFAHSSVMEEASSVPWIFEGWREVLIKEGAWISLYEAVASRPAYLCITVIR